MIGESPELIGVRCPGVGARSPLGHELHRSPYRCPANLEPSTPGRYQKLRNHQLGAGMGVAVGYIHETYSGLSEDTERAAIEARARAARLELVELLVIPRDYYMPLLRLYQVIDTCAADVVIVPTAEHVWTGRRALAERVRVDVVAPPAVWPLGHRWPNHLVAP